MPDEDRALEVSGRLGLASRAAIWALTGSLALRLGFEGHSAPGKEPDRQGALHTLARQPFGHVLVVLLAVGFIAMVVWSVAEVVRKRDGERTGHWSKRAVAAGRTVLYAGLALSTIQLLLGKSGDPQKQEKATADVLSWPAGRLLVGAVAVALFAAAAFNVYRAVSRKYEKHWDRRRMDARARRLAGPAEAIGNVGHALVFALVGWFLGLAAIRFDASQPKSLDESLAKLVHEPYGRPLCVVVALGMIAWAANAVAQARWRQIPDRD
ncbi:MAG: hypothetical protein QOK28_3223 [Actinomycetota bacterium]|jgi:hypothetical protein